MAQLVGAIQDRASPQRHTQRLRPRRDLALVEAPRSLVQASKDPAKEFRNQLKLAAGFFDQAAGSHRLTRDDFLPALRLVAPQIDVIRRDIGREHTAPLREPPK